MNSSTKTYEKFEFGTVFGADQKSRQTLKPIKRQYSPQEVDAIRAEAYAQGKRGSEAIAQGLQAEALGALSEAARAGLSVLNEAIATHKSQCVALCLAVAQKLSHEALASAPEVPLRAAMEALGKDIEKSARLVLTAPQWTESLKEAVEAPVSRSGFGGSLCFTERAGMATGAFEILWHEGRAIFDPEALAQKLIQDINAGLAAEQSHALQPKPNA